MRPWLRVDKTTLLTPVGAQMLLARITYSVDAPKVMTRCHNVNANVDANADAMYALMLAVLNRARGDTGDTCVCGYCE